MGIFFIIVVSVVVYFSLLFASLVIAQLPCYQKYNDKDRFLSDCGHEYAKGGDDFGLSVISCLNLILFSPLLIFLFFLNLFLPANIKDKFENFYDSVFDVTEKCARFLSNLWGDMCEAKKRGELRLTINLMLFGLLARCWKWPKKSDRWTSSQSWLMEYCWVIVFCVFVFFIALFGYYLPAIAALGALGIGYLLAYRGRWLKEGLGNVIGFLAWCLIHCCLFIILFFDEMKLQQWKSKNNTGTDGLSPGDKEFAESAKGQEIEQGLLAKVDDKVDEGLSWFGKLKLCWKLFLTRLGCWRNVLAVGTDKNAKV